MLSNKWLKCGKLKKFRKSVSMHGSRYRYTPRMWFLGNAELDQRGLLNFYVNCSSIESTVVVTESLLLPIAMMHKAQ